ncbi:pre-mRNA-splicing factor 38B [Lucilia sericata]|uniref:pre-mRNA-splicing factor 38B n=1 Tax=Lucilia sericata TaxID=13632 RepID=UPI0018A83930|nr:pre-mRNA-splicing factor 38B [Lucilia sericata]
METLANKDLKDSILQYKIRLKEILQRLEWTEDKVLKNLNTNSIASNQKEIKKPQSPLIATYPDSCITNNSLVLETPQLQQVLQNNEIEAPRNFRELQANFSREQKLKIYEHVIENTEKLANNTETKVDEGEISLADILAQKKREEKRKKRRFRKSKPTHIEEVRCLVDLQMQALRQFMDNKIKKEVDDTEQGVSDKHEYRNNESYKGSYYNTKVNQEDSYKHEYRNYESYRGGGDYFTKVNHNEERRPYEYNYKRDPYRERFTEQVKRQDWMRDDIGKRPRNRSIEREYYASSLNKVSNERTRYNRSRSKEISDKERDFRKGRSKSKEISYERRKHSRSRSRDGSRHKISRSSERTRSRRSRSTDNARRESKHNRIHSKNKNKNRRKHSRSPSNEKRERRSHERRKHRSRSYEKREKTDYHQKYSKRRDHEKSDEKNYYQEQYYRKQ